MEYMVKIREKKLRNFVLQSIVFAFFYFCGIKLINNAYNRYKENTRYIVRKPTIESELLKLEGEDKDDDSQLLSNFYRGLLQQNPPVEMSIFGATLNSDKTNSDHFGMALSEDQKQRIPISIGSANISHGTNFLSENGEEIASDVTSESDQNTKNIRSKREACIENVKPFTTHEIEDIIESYLNEKNYDETIRNLAEFENNLQKKYSTFLQEMVPQFKDQIYNFLRDNSSLLEINDSAKEVIQDNVLSQTNTNLNSSILPQKLQIFETECINRINSETNKITDTFEEKFDAFQSDFETFKNETNSDLKKIRDELYINKMSLVGNFKNLETNIGNFENLQKKVESLDEEQKDFKNKIRTSIEDIATLKNNEILAINTSLSNLQVRIDGNEMKLQQFDRDIESNIDRIYEGKKQGLIADCVTAIKNSAGDVEKKVDDLENKVDTSIADFNKYQSENTTEKIIEKIISSGEIVKILSENDSFKNALVDLIVKEAEEKLHGLKKDHVEMCEKFISNNLNAKYIKNQFGKVKSLEDDLKKLRDEKEQSDQNHLDLKKLFDELKEEFEQYKLKNP
ncbi:hypothetical protein EDEG_02832 [Edhazardia aedis USNM 41457]|uniref:Uncharacterized protein n=1 Tax=Edhazardia aedis (strain USNM 41457) TaxID=1003232 RepID=J9D5F9_EDHAE|nr:hypothetical protein EDEG_02832 [Edhazardia aedis USNM 41457]|eukprot:EJW02769.1 hypothetical protein EDEG_02832 [Edhazardia aedis USNM 41457]